MNKQLIGILAEVHGIDEQIFCDYICLYSPTEFYANSILMLRSQGVIDGWPYYLATQHYKMNGGKLP
jgi:hypothetical protein